MRIATIRIWSPLLIFPHRHIIPKQPPVGIQDFEEDITVFVAPELRAAAGMWSPLTCGCMHAAKASFRFVSDKLGVASDRFTVVNFKTRQIFVAGTNAPEAIQQAVSSLATYHLGQKVQIAIMT